MFLLTGTLLLFQGLYSCMRYMYKNARYNDDLQPILDAILPFLDFNEAWRKRFTTL